MKKRLSMLMAAIYIFSCVIIPVSAASSLESAKNQQKQVSSKISQLAKEKKALESEIKQKTSDIEKLQADAEKTKDTMQKKSEEISKVNADIDLINKEIDAIEKEYEYKNELFKTRMRVMYQNMNKSSLEIFIESKSFSEFFSRIELISLVKENDEKLIKEIALGKENTEIKKQAKLNELEKKKVQLKTLNAKVSDIKTSRAKMESDVESQKSRLKAAEKKEDEMIELSKELESKISQLQDKTTKYAGGVMKWPTPGYTGISSPYGYRIHPIYKVRKFHTGVDINAPSGASIVAANSGKVILAGWNGGYGNCIIIDHGDGIATLYGHQSKLLVSVGDKVSKGDVIGKVGSTGLSTGPHLHFEVRVNGQTKDPMGYFT
ncbi:murein DD-endopeptidase MepM/ murein hydrolase activator NlpD [Ruminiclostridium sufflavum DSM 19573]|uniref:Murein DD-endopeptidase MepM/ murein hydrolase activator NlpD n=1 Tax=Ruminiclostridium sufflavum DSM 19573 TaxID=1121337 RepID=A0A318XKY0_9FIRM|nr:peptidoglycan DD-metalloendopeptidase family protein [Ruminiclostridium sufflavum]PYG88178.1 murein DD-endopeptidase MepM/ murein hydrolase activator NlpD [Ruminiclostridium sufflavum DSM 19573]